MKSQGDVQQHLNQSQTFKRRAWLKRCLHCWIRLSLSGRRLWLIWMHYCLCFLCSDSRNASVMHSMGVLPKLLFELSDPAVTVQKVTIISCVITSLLKAHFTPLDLNRYRLGMHQSQQSDPVIFLEKVFRNKSVSFHFVRLGLFLVYTLPPLSNKTESKEISDSDLLQDTPGTSCDTHPHLHVHVVVGSNPPLSSVCCRSKFCSSQCHQDSQPAVTSYLWSPQKLKQHPK